MKSEISNFKLSPDVRDLIARVNKLFCQQNKQRGICPPGRLLELNPNLFTPRPWNVIHWPGRKQNGALIKTIDCGLRRPSLTSRPSVKNPCSSVSIRG